MKGKGRMYVVVNKDLKMSVGKTAAQVAHAVKRVRAEAPYTMIVLQGTTEQLHNLNTYLDQNGEYSHHLYIDEGANEILPMSATALAFGNIEEDGYDDTPDFIKNFKLLGK